MKIKNIDIKSKLVLAPMAGYTNKSYRLLCKEMGASLVYSEMISDKGLLYENDKTWEMVAIDKAEHPIALQLFGGNIAEVVKAAKMIDERTDCDIIDLNMGCPVKKVIKSQSGSYLLKDVEYLEEMVRSVVNAVTKPVSVKIRLGWDHDHLNHVEVAKAIQRAGASCICVHGRTKSDFYKGKVLLDKIKEVKEAVTIPVIGNGDVKTIQDLDNMLKTGVDAVMIGRASLGNPWIFQEFECHLQNKEYIYPSNEEKIALLKRHFDMLIELKGEKIATLEMRSLASWYVKGFKNAKEFKLMLMDVKTKTEFIDLVDKCFLKKE